LSQYPIFKILEKVGGFDPKQWGDYLKIRGDTADNLAGLPGVGPVKASRILKACPDFVDLIVSGNAYAFAKVKEIMGAKGNDMLKLAKLGIKERDNLILAKKIVDLYTVKLHYTRPKPSKKSFGQFMLDVGQQHMTEQLYVD
jgi:5'-3' exonuclease